MLQDWLEVSPSPYLMCFFINMEDQMFLSQITCYTFLCMYQPKPLWNCLMETWYMPKEVGLFYVILLTELLYIRWNQFIIFQVTLPTPSHRVFPNFMLVFRMLHLNLLKIVILFTLRVILGYHPTRPRKN